MKHGANIGVSEEIQDAILAGLDIDFDLSK